jgi:hypothetical protein
MEVTKDLMARQYTHSFSIGGRRIATCVDSDTYSITLKLEPGVTKEEVLNMTLFEGLIVKFDE